MANVSLTPRGGRLVRRQSLTCQILSARVNTSLVGTTARQRGGVGDTSVVPATGRDADPVVKKTSVLKLVRLIPTSSMYRRTFTKGLLTRPGTLSDSHVEVTKDDKEEDPVGSSLIEIYIPDAEKVIKEEGRERGRTETVASTKDL